MKVTAIKPLPARPGYYAMSLSGKYAFTLSSDLVLKFGLHTGQECSVTEINKLEQAAKSEKLYERVLRYVTLRPRTQAEISAYLKRAHTSPLLFEQITNKLTLLGYVDDEKFARAYTNDRRRFRPTSRRTIIMELQNKRIDKTLAEAVVGSEQDDERAALSALVRKKRRLSAYQDDLKLMRYLSRQGFAYADIKAVLSSLPEDLADFG